MIGTISSDKEIVFRRLFEASREIVWNAWTQPDQLIKWWAPKGFKVVFQELDIRPGGAWRFILYGTDDQTYQNKIVFDDVKKLERLSYTHSADDREPMQFQTTVIFGTFDFKTEVTLRMLFKSSQERDRAASEHNIVEAGNQTLERLNTFVSDKYRRLFK